MKGIKLQWGLNKDRGTSGGDSRSGRTKRSYKGLDASTFKGEERVKDIPAGLASGKRDGRLEKEKISARIVFELEVMQARQRREERGAEDGPPEKILGERRRTR